MSEIEKVARAMWDYDHKREPDVFEWDWYCNLARVALAAMSESDDQAHSVY